MATKRRAPAPAPFTVWRAEFASVTAAISDGSFGKASVAPIERRMKLRRFIVVSGFRINHPAGESLALLQETADAAATFIYEAGTSMRVRAFCAASFSGRGGA